MCSVAEISRPPHVPKQWPNEEESGLLNLSTVLGFLLPGAFFIMPTSFDLTAQCNSVTENSISLHKINTRTATKLKN
jgi:hypothetical protein